MIVEHRSISDFLVLIWSFKDFRFFRILGTCRMRSYFSLWYLSTCFSCWWVSKSICTYFLNFLIQQSQGNLSRSKIDCRPVSSVLLVDVPVMWTVNINGLFTWDPNSCYKLVFRFQQWKGENRSERARPCDVRRGGGESAARHTGLRHISLPPLPHSGLCQY